MAPAEREATMPALEREFDIIFGRRIASTSARPSEGYGFLNIRDYFGAMLLRYVEKDARLDLITSDSIAGKQHSLYGMINSAGLINRFKGGRLGRNVAPQSIIGLRRDLN
jgi:hypothetical protein